ncbi:MAG: 3-deoxy-D-manno-octulosonic acid transferase [Bacteroidota bacterium]|nr:3-deoxy-D-manno-octulosonic acid transferase [Bacteroidota bacterium]
MKLFYNIFIYLYPKIAWLISGKNAKAKQWINGRKHIFKSLENAFKNNTEKVIWVHCSSLGEFEQGRPIIEAIKKKEPYQKILLTFFSPSGYEVRKDYANADWIFYLPMDSFSHAKRFYDIVQPSLVVFVKYEFWFYYLNEAKQRNIPLLLVSGIFREDQPFFKWYGSFHKQMLDCFTYLFVQNESSATLLNNIGFKDNVAVCGDTRFDRVIDIAQQFKPIALVEIFIGNHPVIVAGSTWTEDDEELDHFANTHPEIKFIIAPHVIEEERIRECLTLYKNSILYSEIVNHKSHENKNVLIIDNIGMLSSLYKYATICYVGGGFGDDGVHNVLEAAVYNKPVVFGDEYDKYFEAGELIDADGAFAIESALEAEKIFHELLHDDKLYKQVSINAGNYVKSKSGATEKIMNYLYEKRLLTI